MTLATSIKGGPGSGHHGHRGRPGKRGGSAASRNVVSLEYLLDRGSEGYPLLHTRGAWQDPTETWARHLPSVGRTKDAVTKALVEGQFPISHVQNLAFSNRARDIIKRESTSVGNWEFNLLGWYGNNPSGLSMIGVNPLQMVHRKAPIPLAIVAHEIGHHVTDRINKDIWQTDRPWPEDPSIEYAPIEGLGDLVEFDLWGIKEDPVAVAKFGLRPSVIGELDLDEGELAADMYLTWLYGTPDQKRNLDGLLTKHTLPSLEELFAP